MKFDAHQKIWFHSILYVCLLICIYYLFLQKTKD